MAKSCNSAPTYENPPFRRNCEMETCEPVCGLISGQIPEWLQGELVRVGPGVNKIGNDRYSHVFDGLAILHKFTIKDAKAFYQNRILQSDSYKKNMEAKRIVVSEFGTMSHPDPCQSIFGKLKSNFQTIYSILTQGETAIEITDNCVVNVAYYGDQLYAMTESTFVRRVDPLTLNTFPEKTSLLDYVTVNTATAHPHVLTDGTIINVGSIFRHANGPHYAFFKVPPADNSTESCFAQSKLIAEIPYRWKLHAGYFHSFGITSSGKLVFAELPFRINLLGMGLAATGMFTSKSYSQWMKWSSKEKTRFYVISMETGEVHKVIYEADELFFFHHINAYEENDEIVVDVAGYSDANWVGELADGNGKKSGKFSDRPGVYRCILPLTVNDKQSKQNLVNTTASSATAYLRKGTQNVVDITPEYLTEDVLELPRINYLFNGKPYLYFYGLQATQEIDSNYEFAMDTITKVNAKTKEKICWHADKKCTVSEPVFVADPSRQNAAAAEDDGVVLSMLLHDHDPTCVALLVLDARNMKEIARVDFTALGTVTGTFHGQWAQFGDKVHLQ